jgi:hypothetical protein
MERPNELRRVRIVLQGLSNLRNEHRQIGIGNEGAGPETLVELNLADGPRPGVDEHLQQLERLGRKMDRLAVAKELACLDIQRE